MPASSLIKHKIAFSLAAPEARTVLLVGDFSQWQESPVALKPSKNGVWKTTLSLAKGSYEYRFLVDGEWRDDPNCPQRVPNPFGAENCVRTVA